MWCGDTLWRRLEGGQKRKQLLRGKRDRSKQVSVERNLINSRAMRMGSWRGHPEKKERGKNVW